MLRQQLFMERVDQMVGSYYDQKWSSGKTTVNYNGYVSVDWLGKKLDLLNLEQYAKYQYEWWTLAGEMNQYARMFGGDYRMMDFIREHGLI